MTDGRRFRGQHLIPQHMQDVLARYLFKGVRPGDFLSAVLANDLVQAFGQADATNEEMMWHYATWLYNHAPHHPTACWGSWSQVNWWCEQGGADGLGLDLEVKDDG